MMKNLLEKIKGFFKRMNEKVNTKRLLIAFVLTLAVGGIALSLVDYALKSEDSAVFTVSSGTEYQVMEYKNNVLMVNNEGMSLMDKEGTTLWNVPLPITSPMVFIEDEYILLIDARGKTAHLYKGEKEVSFALTENEILTASLNKKGYFALVTSETGYKGKVAVYSKKGEEIFNWHSGEGYISAIDLSDKNILAVSQVRTDNLLSRVMGINVRSGKEVFTFDKEEVIFATLDFGKDGEVVALSEKALVGISKSGKERFSVDLRAMDIKYYDIKGENIIIASEGPLNNTVINRYTRRGKERKAMECEEDLQNISSYGDKLAGTYKDVLAFVKPGRKIVPYVNLNQDVRNICFFNRGRNVLVVGSGRASIYRFK